MWSEKVAGNPGVFPLRTALLGMQKSCLPMTRSTSNWLLVP